MQNFVFNPIAGLRDSATYQSKPPSGTGVGSARDQVQGRMDEIATYINGILIPNINGSIWGAL